MGRGSGAASGSGAAGMLRRLAAQRQRADAYRARTRVAPALFPVLNRKPGPGDGDQLRRLDCVLHGAVPVRRLRRTPPQASLQAPRS
ncbi:hypothetical protein C3492_20005 [Streptomyces sp. Ru62]|nr:hypothetical protein C3492_20005 [Streptomyces sp. Ru62]